ncbi:SGNH/GDSL hydrolase family protein [Paludisphaera mucosa]|uniref:SGNH/GDSL hydrolase family protein n=1 Tax=Paludisphaera mucosa TaxID=3030827 RepID=A0ABT6FBJ8_9BACT|nr:SGNH/GDSL hydrolase family protein [Paludisphaera mucosa]MDG3004819.1 SGNH/GDSL hydrolase family protein [Paludisphaera mucosa]
MTRPLVANLRRTLKILRDGWLLVGLCLGLIVALELGLRGVFALKDRVAAPPSLDPRVVRDGYADEPWPRIHYRELEALSDRWEPYVYFRQRPFRGRTITIDDQGRRAVWRPPAGRGTAIKILVLGGSSLWGFGARDDETIPSLLARFLDERGVVAEVRNLAEIGHVSTQETIALARELQAGYRPDVVLFYDGVNDTASALLEGKAGLTTNERNRVREFNLLQSPGRMAAAIAGRVAAESALQRLAKSLGRRFLGSPESAYPAPPAADLDALARGVVDAYQANLDLVDALAARYGFRALFAWQPVVFDRAAPTPFEREEAAKYAWLAPLFAKVAAEIGRRDALRTRADFLDLSAIFRDAPELVFIDYCHTTERANARIAERLTGPVTALLPAR